MIGVNLLLVASSSSVRCASKGNWRRSNLDAQRFGLRAVRSYTEDSSTNGLNVSRVLFDSNSSNSSRALQAESQFVIQKF